MQGIIGKSVLGLLILVLIAVTASFATVWLQTFREFRHLESREAKLKAEFVALQRERTRKEAYLRLVLEDPAFLERVVREKLGYVRPDETIYLFDDRR